MSILDDLATWNDFPKALQQVIPSEDRNFERRNEPFRQSTVPVDNHMAQDSNNEHIKQVQTFLKSSPLGVVYSGPIDGKINSTLINTVINLENLVKQKYPSENIILIFGDKILASGFSKLQKILQNQKEKPQETKKIEKEEKEEKEENKKENNIPENEIKEFQKMFNLPLTGKIDNQLISAVKSAENEISKAINDNSVKGMVWDDIRKKFKTTAFDLQSALKLIKK